MKENIICLKEEELGWIMIAIMGVLLITIAGITIGLLALRLFGYPATIIAP